MGLCHTKTTSVFYTDSGWGTRCLREGRERPCEKMRLTHLILLGKWSRPSGKAERQCVSDSTEPHSWVHSVVCFTQLSREGSAQLTGVNVLGGFFPRVIPFRVTALRDMPIWFEFITVVTFKYITNPPCEETFLDFWPSTDALKMKWNGLDIINHWAYKNNTVVNLLYIYTRCNNDYCTAYINIPY